MVRRAQSTDLQDDLALFYPGTHRFSVPLREKGITVMPLGVGVSSKRTRKGDLADRLISELQHIRARIVASFE